MSAHLENSAVATGLERSVFIPIPKKGNAKECSNYCTVALISHASKIMIIRSAIWVWAVVAARVSADWLYQRCRPDGLHAGELSPEQGWNKFFVAWFYCTTTCSCCKGKPRHWEWRENYISYCLNKIAERAVSCHFEPE